MKRQAMIKRVAQRKLAQIEREGGSLKDFFKGIVYDDYEIAIQNLVEKAVYSEGPISLVPFRQVPNTIKVSDDQVFVDSRGAKYVVALNESIPLIGLSLLMSAGHLTNNNKASKALLKMMKSKGLRVQPARDYRRELERMGLGSLLMG